MLRLSWIGAVVATLAISAMTLTDAAWAQGGVELLKSAQEAEAARNRSEALRLYSSAIESGNLAPAQLASAYYRRGALRGALGDSNLGIEDFSRSIELNSQFGNAWSLRGYLRGVVGQYELAEKDHLTAIKLADRATWAEYPAWTLQHMADLWRRRGNYAKALEYCEQALQRSNYSPVLLRRAWIHMDAGNTPKAKADFAAFRRAAEQQKLSFDVFWPDEREAINRLGRL